MKNFLNRPLGLFSLIISGLAVVAISFYSFSFANEGDPDQGLEEMDDPVVLGGREGPTANPTCVDHYDSWSHSTEFNPDAEWSLAYFPVVDLNTEPGFRQFTDINGDGLLDFIYVRKARVPQNYPEHNDTYSCLMLNNGHGWDLAYRCVVRKKGVQGHQGEYEIVFYGDCAVLDEDE